MKLRNRLVPLLFSLVCACGGSSKDSTTPGEGLPIENESLAAAGETNGAMPTIPSAPVDAPANVLAHMTIGDLNSQMTGMALFADGVSPGMGAFVTPQLFLQAIQSQLGADGISGIDEGGPMHVIMTDAEHTALVVRVTDEQALNGSLTGTTRSFVHGGFALIGHENDLRDLAPFAFATLAAPQPPSLPTLVVHMENLMAGELGAQVREGMLRQAGAPGSPEAMGAQFAVEAFEGIKKATVALDANEAQAQLFVTADLKDGKVREFAGQQSPANFSGMKRVGSGPWGVAVAGKLNFSALAPLIAQVGGQGNPMMDQMGPIMNSLSGEMALGLNMAKTRELVFSMQLGGDGSAMAAMLNPLIEAAAQSAGTFDQGSFKGKVKANSIKSSGGNLHEIEFTPTTPELKKQYGNKVSAFAGIAGGYLTAVFGPSARQQAQALATANGALKGKGSYASAAATAAAGNQESLVVLLDVQSLQGMRDPKDSEPVVIGVGFTPTQLKGRVVLPVSLVKEASANMGAGF